MHVPINTFENEIPNFKAYFCQKRVKDVFFL